MYDASRFTAISKTVTNGEAFMSVAIQTQSSAIAVSSLSKDQNLPLLIQPANAGNTWEVCEDDIKLTIKEHLMKTGGVLLRGFSGIDDQSFKSFAKSFGYPLLTYDYASTPRTEVDGGVYTSTEYPSHQIIPLHNEQAYTKQWPMKIWFCCIKASSEGGETPIADSRKVYNTINPNVRERFASKKLMYVRNYGNGLDLPWQKAFGTEDKQIVENFCRQNTIEFEWKEDGELRTREICQAVAQHPHTKENVWFNQAHLFHVSNLDPSLQETLISIVGKNNLPRNVYYGDGSDIEESDLNHIRQVLNECQIKFPWQEGDMLMLDNMLAAHGRSTFSGERKVIVAMAEANS